MATANVVPLKNKRQRRRFFNLSTGFDMTFFVLLMIILVVGLATLYSASHVYAFTYDGDSYFYIRKQLLDYHQMEDACARLGQRLLQR